jgi:hypothetical protein
MGPSEGALECLSSTQVGLHSVKNVLGDQSQISLFSDHDVHFSEKYGVELRGSISRFGVDLSDMELRVMEGILHGFSLTGYRGNSVPKSRDEIVSEEFGGQVPPVYQNVIELPILRATQSQILEWSGINRNSIAAWGRGVKAINSLGITQFCFYYDRAVYENGKPVRDKDGGWKKEQVVTVGQLFNIKEVREDSTGVLKYYEVTPSPIFLDQRESYFMAVPFNWREEVRSLYGNKKASGYLFLFLIWLRYQYELKRRKKNAVARPYQIKWSPEEIARAIKMPEGTIAKRKKQMLSVLEDCYSVAQKLGYLTHVEKYGHLHVLTLDDDKYLGGGGESAIDKVLKNIGPPEGSGDKLQVAGDLVSRFHENRVQLDPAHKASRGGRRCKEELLFLELLSRRSKEDVIELIKWSGREYWCSRLSTVAKLVKYFDEAYPEMQVEKAKSPSGNREFIEQLLSKLGRVFQHGTIEVLNKHVEFCAGIHSTCFEYTDKRFREKILSELARWGLSV